MGRPGGGQNPGAVARRESARDVDGAANGAAAFQRATAFHRHVGGGCQRAVHNQSAGPDGGISAVGVVPGKRQGPLSFFRQRACPADATLDFERPSGELKTAAIRRNRSTKDDGAVTAVVEDGKRTRGGDRVGE